MSQQDPWIPIEPDWETILEKYPNPIQALAEMRTPAPVIRQAYNPAQTVRDSPNDLSKKS